MISPNITADHYPNELHLRRVSPSARRQMHLPPEAKPFDKQFRRRLLATLRDDDEFCAAVAKMIGGRNG